MNMMATIKDIAKDAGVSISTVSHVINKTRYVSPELVKRVEDALRQAGTPPNFVIKKLRAERDAVTNRFIALFYAEERAFFTELKEKMSRQNLALLMVNYCNTAELLAMNDLLASPACAAILVCPGAFPDKAAQLLPDYTAPKIAIGEPVEGADLTLDLDSVGSTRRAIRHLVRSGHENILFLSNSLTRTAPQIGEYCRMLTQSDIAVHEDLICLSVGGEFELFEKMDALMSKAPAPTAVFMAEPDFAAPLLRYISSRNIQCPEHLSIISAVDFEWAPLLQPPLSAVSYNNSQVADTLTGLICHIIENSSDKILSTANCGVRSKLILRNSTRGIARGPFGERAESADKLVISENDAEQIAGGRYTAAVSFHYTGQAWMDLITKGMTDVFKGLGINIIATTDAHFDPELQCRQLESIRHLHPDIIIGVPTDAQKTSAAFKSAADDSKLIFLTGVPTEFTRNDYVTCVSVNDRSQGRYIGQKLGEYMEQYHLTKVGLLKHNALFSATNQRDSAAEQVFLEEFDNIKIAATGTFNHENDAYTATLYLIRNNPQIQALYVPWEGPARKVIHALTDIGRQDIAVGTGGLDLDSAKILGAGGMIKVLSAQQPYEQGRAVALAAAGALLGRDVPSFIAVEPIGVHPGNLEAAWKEIFKDEAPLELREILRTNPQYHKTV